jgi:hypothetical protein
MKKFLIPLFRILLVGAIVLSFPHFAMAYLVMDDYLLFGGGAVTLNSTSIIAGNVYSGGAITVTGATFTHADYVGSITGTPASGTTSNISSLGALDPNSDILTLLGTYTTFLGVHNFTSSDAAGVYYVTGAVTFDTGATGNWTIISDGAFTGTDVHITPYIAASGDFPNGLALYGAGALTLTGSNDISGAVAVAGAVTEEGRINSPSSQVPIPAAVWLLGTGLVGLVGLRRKFQK